MKLPALLPPADLLKQIEGIEGALRRAKRLGTVGRFGVAGSAVEIAMVVHNSEWLTNLQEFNWSALLSAQNLPLFFSILLLVFCFVLANWTRFWLRESQEPFRYTFWVEKFAPLEHSLKEEQKLAWLHQDLISRLNQRIARLSLFDESRLAGDSKAKPADKDGGDEQRTSHIHVAGNYVVRKEPDTDGCKGLFVLEVFPRIRIGPRDRPETLGHPVRFKLDEPVPDDAPQAGKPPAGEAAGGALGSKGPETPKTGLTARGYERFVERVYFSVASEIYAQIKRDVERKIDLLPTNHFRAAAYFHEAQDYARSNTLDAYNEALKLYRRAMLLYDVSIRARPLSFAGALAQMPRIAWGSLRSWARRALAHLWTASGHLEVMAARTCIGFSDMLAYQNVLATLSGHEPYPVYEARPVVEYAVERLKILPKCVKERESSLFDAYLTLALVFVRLESIPDARKLLVETQRLQPERTDRDARFLYVKADLESRLFAQLPYYRLAVELDPKFEIARFQLAYASEMVWRNRPSLEASTARMVFNEYDEVLRLNPANIGAWANRGYMLWLLDPFGQPDEESILREVQNVRSALAYGREYKEVRAETYVSELDYGLARLAAEQGELREAYQHYVAAMAGLLARGISRLGEGFVPYYFDYIGDSMLERFRRYLARVEQHARDKQDVPQRVRNSVLAFALNDLGDACLYYYKRSRYEPLLVEAEKAYQRAARLSPNFLRPHFNLANLRREKNHYQDAMQSLEEVRRLQPNWSDGILSVADTEGQLALVEERHVVRKGEYEPELVDQARDKRSAAAGKRTEIEKVLRKDTAWDLTPSQVGDLEQGLYPGESRCVDSRTLLFSGPDQALPRTSRGPAWAIVDELKRQSEQLDKEANELESEASALKEQAKLHLKQANKHRDNSVELIRLLLPHYRLSESRDSHVSVVDTDGHHVERFLASRGIDWEKEFRELHVSALHTWARSLANRADKKGSMYAGYRLLRHIQHCFLPNSWGLLLDLRKICWSLRKQDPSVSAWRAKYRKYRGAVSNNRRRSSIALIPLLATPRAGYKLRDECRATIKACNQRLRELIIFSLERDPASVSSLDWLVDYSVSARDIANVLPQVLRTMNSVPGLCLVELVARLGKQAEELKKDSHSQEYQGILSEVRDACDQACETTVRRLCDPDALFRLGINVLAMGLSERAQEAFERAMDCDPRWVSRKRGDYLRYIGFALWKEGEKKRALERLEEMGTEMEADNDDWRAEIIEALGSYGAGPEDYNLLGEWLRSAPPARGEHEGGLRRRDAQKALIGLAKVRHSSALYDSVSEFERKVVEEAPSSTVTPVAIEADNKWFPDGQEWAENHPIFRTYIPDIRQRIKSDFGIQIPGVRVRANTDSDLGDKYLLYVNDVALVSGEVPPDSKFCPDLKSAAAAMRDGVALPQPSFNPLTGDKDGVWLKQNELRKDNVLETWDRFEFMIRHLELVLRSRLPVFLGHQELSQILTVWEDEGDLEQRRALRKSALAGSGGITRLLQVINALLREEVPIADLEVILRMLAEAQASEEPLMIAERIRLKLRSRLPGNETARQVIPLSPGFESMVSQNVHEGRFLAIDPTKAQDLLSALRDRVDGFSQQQLTLMVCNASIRPYVRRLTEIEFPRIPVLAERELTGNFSHIGAPVIYPAPISGG